MVKRSDDERELKPIDFILKYWPLELAAGTVIYFAILFYITTATSNRQFPLHVETDRAFHEAQDKMINNYFMRQNSKIDSFMISHTAYEKRKEDTMRQEKSEILSALKDLVTMEKNRKK